MRIWKNNKKEAVKKERGFLPVEIPHDWQIYDASFFYEDCSGWYRKKVICKKEKMETKKNSKMSTMSGGEQQRVAIAIALANSPGLLLADEPTGSVDTRTADVIFDIFTELNKAGQTILIVTHDVALSKKVKRVVAIRDGKISSERILKEKYADRLKEITVDWRNEDTQEEYVIIDKAGRVQIPREILDKMNLRDNKVKLEYQDDKVIIGAPEEI